MQKCCIKDCESHKGIGTKDIGHFQFPLNDPALLKKWLRQIDLPDWMPATYHHICSLHFREQDLSRLPNEKKPRLKPAAVPTVFPALSVESATPKPAAPKPAVPKLAAPTAAAPKAATPKSSASETPVPTKIINNSSNGFQLSTKFISVVSAAPVLHSSPVLLIPSPYPQELPSPFPTQIIAQNLSHSMVNNSMKISMDYTEEIGGHCLFNSTQSVSYSRQTNPQIPRTDAYIAQIDAQQRPLQCAPQIIAQLPKQFTERVVAQAPPAEIGQCYPTQVTVPLDPGRDREQQISESVGVLVPIVQPRLRKILPKPQQFDPNTVPTVGSLSKGQSDFTTNSIPKPDILIIPKIENSQLNGSAKVAPTRFPGNKRPILRISINKLYHSNKAHCRSDDEEINCSRIDGGSIDNADSSTGEITIENPTTNKTITFKLDPTTGEIVVATRRIGEQRKDDPDVKCSRTETRLEDTYPSATKLRELCIKSQQECNALRRRLLVLRQRHKREQEDIQHLQEQLIELGDKVEDTCREDKPESRFPKRKDVENNVQPENSKISTRKLKRTKHDVQGPGKDTSTVANGLPEGSQPADNCNNGAFKLPKIEELSEGEAAVVSSATVVRKVEVTTSLGSSRVSLSEDPACKAEVLDAEFLIG